MFALSGTFPDSRRGFAGRKGFLPVRITDGFGARQDHTGILTYDAEQ